MICQGLSWLSSSELKVASNRAICLRAVHCKYEYCCLLVKLSEEVLLHPEHNDTLGFLLIKVVQDLGSPGFRVDFDGYIRKSKCKVAEDVDAVLAKGRRDCTVREERFHHIRDHILGGTLGGIALEKSPVELG